MWASQSNLDTSKRRVTALGYVESRVVRAGAKSPLRQGARQTRSRIVDRFGSGLGKDMKSFRQAESRDAPRGER